MQPKLFMSDRRVIHLYMDHPFRSLAALIHSADLPQFTGFRTLSIKSTRKFQTCRVAIFRNANSSPKQSYGTKQLAVCSCQPILLCWKELGALLPYCRPCLLPLVGGIYIYLDAYFLVDTCRDKSFALLQGF